MFWSNMTEICIVEQQGSNEYYVMNILLYIY